MDQVIQYTLYVHILVGTISLLSGAISIFTAKGKTWHRQAGKIYFYAMTAVFITGIVIAGYKMNHFLFLIAFLSYYSVFCGVRCLKLKKLHKTQSPKWYDWLAGIVNTVANAIFVGLGLYYVFSDTISLGGTLLTLGFGIGGLAISYANLKPFIIRPKEAYHWYMAHIGNMMGGYIATFTAFLSTIVTRYDLMNPFVAFALPSLIGVPLLLFWQRKVEKSFTKR